MSIFRSLRTGTSLILLLAVTALMMLQLVGCSDADITPTNVETATAPVLPEADQLMFDFSFFDTANQLDKAAYNHDNFLNAYLRTVLLQAMAHLVLAPPVTAFSAAIHTVPEAQDDGSWLWSYTWESHDGPVNILLRGMPATEVVQWDLSLVPGGSEMEYPWFSGTTNGDGEEGHWVFRNLDTEGFPVSGEISWGQNETGDYLEFVSLEDEEYGDTLRFTDNHPDYRIDFIPGDAEILSFIRWNADGSGSLMVPDYNEGNEACWNTDLVDTLCQ